MESIFCIQVEMGMNLCEDRWGSRQHFARTGGARDKPL